jgi:ribonucrease Y
MTYLLPILLALMGLLVGGFFGYRISMRGADGHYGTRVREAEELLNSARQEAEVLLHESRLEIEEQQTHEREKLEDLAQRASVKAKDHERALREREMTLEKKLKQISNRELDCKHKEERLENRSAQIDHKESKVDEIIEQQNAKLESIARLTLEEARDHLFQNLEKKVLRDSSQHFNEICEHARVFASEEARRILVNAMERTAVEQSAQSTVTVVTLPSDDIKGRIIGREGRNIRTFESVTGVELLVDDTPRAVILSSFDPLRREVARISLDSLITDGRIHPARIEEVVDRVREEMDTTVMEIGEQAMLDLGVHGLHPELIRHLGRLAFRNTMGQNLLAHVKEVASIAGILAAELKLDPRAVRRAGLLHEIGCAVDGYSDVDVCELSGDLARKYGEREEIERAIREQDAKHTDPSVMAVLISIANKISMSRPGIRAEHMGKYIQRLTDLESIARDFPGVEAAYVLQAGRELRVVVEPAEVADDQIDALAADISRRIQYEMHYPGQIRVTVAREFRSIGVAK